MRPILALLLCTGLANQAHAEAEWLVQPVQMGDESVRYVKGVPTVELAQVQGIVRVTPLPLDHGRLSFTVAVYNNGAEPVNFGIENLAPNFFGAPVPVLSKDKLVKMAKNRAFWSQFGLAVLGATASSLAASQRSYYSSTLVTPRGTYRSIFSAPSIAGQYQAAMTTAGTAAGIVLIQSQLDRTILALGDQVVQTTTIDPGESYAGRIVIDKVRPKNFPTPIAIAINWNGESYPLTFQIAKPGTPAPVFSKLTRSGPPAFVPRVANLAQAPKATPEITARDKPKEKPPSTPQSVRSHSSFGNGRVTCITCGN